MWEARGENQLRRAFVRFAAITSVVACSKPLPARTQVDFTLAFGAPRPHTVAVTVPDGRTVYAEASAVLTERDVKSAVTFRSNGRLLLGIRFEPRGARILENVSRANVGNYLLLSLDKTPTLAVRISAPISDGIAKLDGLTQNEDELKALASRIRNW